MEATPTAKMAWISEELCIGCGICVKVAFANLSAECAAYKSLPSVLGDVCMML